MGLVVLSLSHKDTRRSPAYSGQKKRNIAIQRVQLIAKEITDTASV